MIRLGDLALFAPLTSGEMAQFVQDDARLVRLEINSPHPCSVYVVPVTPDGEIPDGEEPILLAPVHGLAEIEFHARGAFALQHDGERIWLRCKDGQEVHHVAHDAETFTTLYERRPRNPEIEALQEMLLRNQERRMASVYDDIRIQRERLEHERAALDQRARNTGGDQPPPKPANGAGKPASGVGTPPVGDEGATGDA